MKRLLQEGALVAAIGAVLAFAANAFSPHRLVLSRNYFPAATRPSPAPAAQTNATSGTVVNTNSPVEPLSARLRQDGLQLADSNKVVQLFHDPRREQDGVIFIDSRDEEHYRAGHIPGAYLFNRFHADNYLTNVVGVCQAAEQIVFYCNGGDCDDSEQTAIMLRDSMNIPKEKVWVYGGGMHEWTTNGLPVELGARNSGQLTNMTHSATAPTAEASNR